MDNITFYEFEKIYLAYVWVNVTNLSGIHPGIFIIKKPFDLKNLSKKTIKKNKYYIYINLYGIIKTINIKYIETITNRKTFNAKHLINMYQIALNAPPIKYTVINEDYLK